MRACDPRTCAECGASGSHRPAVEHARSHAGVTSCAPHAMARSTCMHNTKKFWIARPRAFCTVRMCRQLVVVGAGRTYRLDWQRAHCQGKQPCPHAAVQHSVVPTRPAMRMALTLSVRRSAPTTRWVRRPSSQPSSHTLRSVRAVQHTVLCRRLWQLSVCL